MKPVKINNAKFSILTLILLISSTKLTFAQPANDLQSNAISINSNVGEYFGTTVDATSTDEPNICVTSVTAPGVWYTMSGVKGGVTIDLCASPFDSKINVYVDDGVGGLTCVTGEDDDSTNCGSGNDPHITFGAQSTKTYYIYVNGADGDVGTFTLRVKCNNNQVINQKDDGFGSLREVITYASDGDTITFNSVVDGRSIILSSGPIWINKDLRIMGNGMNKTIIDGIISDHRLFIINSDGNKVIHMENLTIQNGGSATVSLPGAGLDNFEDLTLLNVKFKNNQASGKSVSALRIRSGNATMVNCIFEENIVHNPTQEAATITALGMSSVKILQCLFINNSGNNLIFSENTISVEIKNNTTYNNTANNHIISIERNELYMHNNIISETSNPLYLGTGITATSITHNLSGVVSASLLASDDNVAGDPLFINPANEDFNLSLASPCFNTGDSKYLPLDLFDIDNDTDTSENLPTDLSGLKARVISSSPDMGAFERIPYACEDANPILISETVTADITDHIINLVCDATFESRLHYITPTVTDTVTISLSNYSDNKNMFLYTDEICNTNCDDLMNSVSATSPTEQIRYKLTANITYYIEVYDYSKTGGTYDLNLVCDTCSMGFNFISPVDDIADGMVEHSTDGIITSNVKITGSNTDATYSARNSVLLNNGFHVALGAAFEANTDGEDTSTPTTPKHYMPHVAVAPHEESYGNGRRPDIK